MRERLAEQFAEQLLVEFGFRYGRPSIPDGVRSLLDQGARKILVLPLYPQYSAATGGSTFDALAEDMAQRRWIPDLRLVTHYHDHPEYVTALAASVQRHWDQHGRAERLLMSFHAIPQRYVDSGDPYFCECHKTARLLAERLGLVEEDYQLAFQSRFGREPWLQPDTDEVLKQLAGQGVRAVQVICPGFSADCLETLEEIDMRYRELFIAAGGDRFEYIPALNSDPAHITLLTTLVRENLQGWIS